MVSTWINREYVYEMLETNILFALSFCLLAEAKEVQVDAQKEVGRNDRMTGRFLFGSESR